MVKKKTFIILLIFTICFSFVSADHNIVFEENELFEELLNTHVDDMSADPNVGALSLALMNCYDDWNFGCHHYLSPKNSPHLETDEYLRVLYSNENVIHIAEELGNVAREFGENGEVSPQSLEYTGLWMEFLKHRFRSDVNLDEEAEQAIFAALDLFAHNERFYDFRNNEFGIGYIGFLELIRNSPRLAVRYYDNSILTILVGIEQNYDDHWGVGYSMSRIIIIYNNYHNNKAFLDQIDEQTIELISGLYSLDDSEDWQRQIDELNEVLGIALFHKARLADDEDFIYNALLCVNNQACEDFIRSSCGSQINSLLKEKRMFLFLEEIDRQAIEHYSAEPGVNMPGRGMLPGGLENEEFELGLADLITLMDLHLTNQFNCHQKIEPSEEFLAELNEAFDYLMISKYLFNRFESSRESLVEAIRIIALADIDEEQSKVIEYGIEVFSNLNPEAELYEELSEALSLLHFRSLLNQVGDFITSLYSCYYKDYCRNTLIENEESELFSNGNIELFFSDNHFSAVLEEIKENSDTYHLSQQEKKDMFTLLLFVKKRLDFKEEVPIQNYFRPLAIFTFDKFTQNDFVNGQESRSQSFFRLFSNIVLDFKINDRYTNVFMNELAVFAEVEGEFVEGESISEILENFLNKVGDEFFRDEEFGLPYPRSPALWYYFSEFDNHLDVQEAQNQMMQEAFASREILENVARLGVVSEQSQPIVDKAHEMLIGIYFNYPMSRDDIIDFFREQEEQHEYTTYHYLFSALALDQITCRNEEFAEEDQFCRRDVIDTVIAELLPNEFEFDNGALTLVTERSLDEILPIYYALQEAEGQFSRLTGLLGPTPPEFRAGRRLILFESGQTELYGSFIRNSNPPGGWAGSSGKTYTTMSDPTDLQSQNLARHEYEHFLNGRYFRELVAEDDYPTGWFSEGFATLIGRSSDQQGLLSPTRSFTNVQGHGDDRISIRELLTTGEGRYTYGSAFLYLLYERHTDLFYAVISAIGVDGSNQEYQEIFDRIVNDDELEVEFQEFLDWNIENPGEEREVTVAPVFEDLLFSDILSIRLAFESTDRIDDAECLVVMEEPVRHFGCVGEIQVEAGTGVEAWQNLVNEIEAVTSELASSAINNFEWMNCHLGEIVHEGNEATAQYYCEGPLRR